jgi:glycosyltransferase involved in cell wall biosynthesis
MQTNLLKLLIFNPSREDGGVEKNLFIITNYLDDRISGVNLITTNFQYATKFSKRVKLIFPRYYLSNKYGRLPRYFLCIIELIIFIIKHRRKVLILSFQANIYAIIIAKIFNIRIISRSNTSPTGWSQNFFKQIIFSFLLKKTRKIIVNSYQFKKIMDKKYKLNCQCILNPFNFNLISKLSRVKIKEDFFKSKKKLKIISVGRLVHQKDHMTLVKAINIVAKSKRNIEVIILGKGIEKDNLKNYINTNNLQSFVKLIGYKKNPFNYIKQADIFILSSIYEGSPNVLVEAQFLKKYIISSNCPTGPKDILANGLYGDLFQVGNYKKLANLILNYNYNLKKGMISQGFRNAFQYDKKKSCEQYLSLVLSHLRK